MAGEIRRVRIAFIGGSFDRRRLPLLGVRTTVPDSGRRRTSATGRSALARPGDRARGRGGVRSVAVFRTRVAGEPTMCPAPGFETTYRRVGATCRSRRCQRAPRLGSSGGEHRARNSHTPSPVWGPGSVQAPPERERLARRRGDRGGRARAAETALTARIGHGHGARRASDLRGETSVSDDLGGCSLETGNRSVETAAPRREEQSRTALVRCRSLSPWTNRSSVNAGPAPRNPSYRVKAQGAAERRRRNV